MAENKNSEWTFINWPIWITVLNLLFILILGVLPWAYYE